MKDSPERPDDKDLPPIPGNRIPRPVVFCFILFVKAGPMKLHQSAISLFFFAMLYTCTPSGDSGSERGITMAQTLKQNPTVTIQINASVPDHQALRAALEEELSKADAGGAVSVKVVQGSPVSDRFTVAVGSKVPPSILMRLKKVLRSKASSAQPTFRTSDQEPPHQVYVGRPS